MVNCCQTLYQLFLYSLTGFFMIQLFIKINTNLFIMSLVIMEGDILYLYNSVFCQKLLF